MYLALSNIMANISKAELHKEFTEFCKIVHPVKVEVDGALSVLVNHKVIDTTALDKAFADNDSEYDHVLCRYKGKPCSLIGYIQQKYGDYAVAIFERNL